MDHAPLNTAANWSKLERTTEQGEPRYLHRVLQGANHASGGFKVTKNRDLANFYNKASEMELKCSQTDSEHLTVA